MNSKGELGVDPVGRKNAVRKARFHWTPRKDIDLIHAVIEFSPHEYGTKAWKSIATKLAEKYQVNERGCKLRCTHLVKLYKARELATLKKSGTEEEFNERDILLEELVTLEETKNNDFLQSLDDRQDESQNIGIDPKFEEEDVIILNNGTSEFLIPAEIHCIPNSSLSTNLGQGLQNPKENNIDAALNLSDKQKGDKIRRQALDNSLRANLADEPFTKRPRRAMDFNEIFEKKATLEEKRMELEKINKKTEYDNLLEIERERLKMEERIAMRKLELDHDDKQCQRDWAERQEIRESERRRELTDERKLSDERMLKLVELLKNK